MPGQEDDATYTVVMVLLFLHGCCLFSTKKKLWPSTWSMNFFCAITQNLNSCKNHSTASKYSCNTSINATQFICAHKTWSDGGENSNHTNSWKPCNTNPIHHTIPNFSFCFFLFFLFLYHENSTNRFRIFTILHFLEWSHPLVGYFFKLGKC